MASPYGIDLGNVLSQAEDLTAARTRNRLAAMQLDDELRARELRGGAVSGDRSQLDALAVLDPSRAGEVVGYIQTLEDQERTNLAANAEEIGRVAWYVLNSDDPEMAYQQVLGQLPEETRAAVPQTYDENWLRLQLAQASSVSDLISQSTSTRATAQTAIGKAALDLDSRLITQEQYDTIVSAEMAKILDEEAPEGLDNSISNSIRATVNGMFGDAINPLTGEWSILDPDKAMQAVNLMALAERMAVEQDLPAARAVQMAAQSQGIDLNALISGRGAGTPSQQQFGVGDDPAGLGL